MRAGRPSVRLAGGHEVPAFRLLGTAGALAGTAVALVAAGWSGLAVQAAICLASVVVFLTVAMGTKAVTGQERLVYYHHEIAVLVVAAFLAWALGAPVLRHLDATVLGLGTFLVAGRLGCFRAACCHGLPSSHGVTYSAEHTGAGLPPYLVGVRLLPVQLVEAAVVAALVIAGAAASSGEPGIALGIYVTGYAVARFGLEALRGDATRRWWHGLSEAQWTSLAVAGAAAVAAVTGAVPGPAPHLVAAGVLLAAAPVMARRPASGLLDPRHVAEVARALPEASGRPLVAETSAGLRLSAGTSAGTAHYTLSRPGLALKPTEVRCLAIVILTMRHPGASARIVDGAAGAVHVVVGP